MRSINSVLVYATNFLPRTLQQAVDQTSAPSVAARVVRGSLWSLAGALLSRVLALVSAMLVARLLGKSIYGELGLIQSTIGMFGTLAAFGMGATATKYIAEFRNKDPQRAGRIIALSSAVSWSTGIILA